MTRTLLPLVALAIACAGGKTTPDVAGEEANTAPPGENHREPDAGEAGDGGATPATPAFDSDSFGDPYFLAAEPAPTVEGHVFKAIARHGGGCAEHTYTFELTGTGRSMPPTALGTLKHNGNGDACRALLITPIEIDLHAALEGKGCFGRVSIATPTVDDPQAVGGAQVFDMDPIGCDEAPAAGE